MLAISGYCASWFYGKAEKNNFLKRRGILDNEKHKNTF